MSQRPPVGIFVVRAWYEDNQFRARVTHSNDVGATETVEVATAKAEDVIGHLNEWLSKLAMHAPPGSEERSL